MLILLPPSETKREGGSGSRFAQRRLSFPALAPVRARLIDDVVALSAEPDVAIRALRLGPKQHAEIDRNRRLRSSPTAPALSRYTGVLYDALDVESLTAEQWRFAAETVAVQSALFGLVGAADPIPAYRLSFDSRLTPSLKKRWSAPNAAVLAARPGLILDLRSEGYAALGPLPVRDGAHYVRVLARDEDGRVRALNHFNKQAKGLLTRALVEAGQSFETTDELLDWAVAESYELSVACDGSRDLELVVPEIAGSPGALQAVLRRVSG